MQTAARATQLPYRRDAAKADPPGGPSPPATRDTVIVVPGRDGAARELVVPVLGSSWPQPPGQYNLLRVQRGSLGGLCEATHFSFRFIF